jgi:uncharacterized protein (TIGR03435 family)
MILSGAASAQVPSNEPLAFDVASIRPANPISAMSISRSGHRLSFLNIPLQMLITWAYDITDDRLLGRPNWLESVRYDVIAQAPDLHVAAGGYQKMMQALLAARFNLSAHRETRRLSTYALTVAKGGPRVRIVEPPETMPQNPFRMADSGHLSGTSVSPEMLAKVLSNQVKRAVVDQTGIKGVFDFTLEWAPDASPQLGAEVQTDIQNRASIFTALQEQLGLKLEFSTALLDVLVIDHVERSPSEN